MLKKNKKWPNLKVSDWRPIACKHYKVEHIGHRDPLYRKIAGFCMRPNQYERFKKKNNMAI